MSFGYDGDLRELARRQEPTPADLDRLSARVELRPRRRRWPVALAAAAAATLALVGSAAWLRPRTWDLAHEPVALGAAVEAVPDGRGTASADGDVVSVRWEEGTIALDVEPGVGADVRVETEEARVRVLGTAFTVERGPFGTEVVVARGTVQVDCSSGDHHALGADTRATCLRDAGAGLGRVLALERSGVPAAARIAAIEEALAHPVGSDGVRAALAERRVAALHELGDCEDGARWLHRLADLGDVPGALRLVQCLADTDRDGARAVADAIRTDGLPADQAAAVAAWRTALAR